MTQQFERLTAEDLDCYTELFSGIDRKLRRVGYNHLYIFNVQKVIRILTIYREWLLSQSSLDFDKLYYIFWNQYEMNITAVSLLLLPKSHSKEQEIERVDATIKMVTDLGTSYIFNDVQTNSVGLALKNTIYPVLRKSLKELYRYSQERENVEYCKNIKEYLSLHSELYPDVDVLAEFFGDNSNELNINLDVKK